MPWNDGARAHMILLISTNSHGSLGGSGSCTWKWRGETSGGVCIEFESK